MVVSWRETCVPFFFEHGDKNLEGKKTNMEKQFEHRRKQGKKVNIVHFVRECIKNDVNCR